MKIKTKNFDYEKVIYSTSKFKSSIVETESVFIRYYSNQFKKLGLTNKKFRLLDIGCGAGEFSITLKKIFPKIDYYACDVSKKAIKMAQKRSSNIKFFVSPAEKLNIKDSYFDIVIMNSVLNHLQNPERSVKEVFRVLKKKGSFLSATPVEADKLNIHGYLCKIDSFKKHRLNYLGHTYFFDRKSIKKVIIKNKLTIKNVRFSWFYFSQILDILYYQLLKLLKKKPGYSMNYYGKNAKGMRAIFVRYIRNIIGVLGNIEDMLASNIPIGLFIFINAKKEI